MPQLITLEQAALGSVFVCDIGEAAENSLAAGPPAHVCGAVAGILLRRHASDLGSLALNSG